MKIANIAIASAFLLVAGGAMAQDAALTDPQIAAIAVAANDVDIDSGKAAKSRATNQQVKDFAQQMVTDHEAVNKQAKDLTKRLKLKPEDNATSKSLKDGGKESLKKLKDLKGAEFDSAYINQEVTYHQSVLDTIDKSLIPNAKNADLKAFLEKIRPAIAAHLDHAKQLQASLGKKGS